MFTLQHQWKPACSQCVECKIHEHLHELKAHSAKFMNTSIKSMLTVANQWTHAWSQWSPCEIHENLCEIKVYIAKSMNTRIKSRFVINEHLHELEARTATSMNIVITNKSRFAVHNQWTPAWILCLQYEINEHLHECKLPKAKTINICMKSRLVGQSKWTPDKISCLAKHPWSTLAKPYF